MRRERRVLAKLIGRYVGTTRGVFELADGSHVEVDGGVEFDSPEAPEPGQKALVVVDATGRALRWEPYTGTRLRRGPT